MDVNALDLSDIPEPSADDMLKSRADPLETLAELADKEASEEESTAAEGAADTTKAEEAKADEAKPEATAEAKAEEAKPAAPAELQAPPDFKSLDDIDLEALPATIKPWIEKVVLAVEPEVRAARASQEAFEKDRTALQELARTVNAATPDEKVRLLSAYHDTLHEYAREQADQSGKIAQAYFGVKHPEFDKAPKDVQLRLTTEIQAGNLQRMKGVHLGEKLSELWNYVQFATGWKAPAAAPAKAAAPAVPAAPATVTPTPGAPSAAAKAANAPTARVSVSLPTRSVAEMSVDDILDEGDELLRKELGRQ